MAKSLIRSGTRRGTRSNERPPLRERPVIAAAREGDVLEVLTTTSQKLVHRIVHELKKAFRGRASYRWSDEDGSPFATWQCD